jgi:hypothetical protein
VCFNGGKDCIVMLHLVHAYFQVKITLNKLPGIFNIVMEPFHIFLCDRPGRGNKPLRKGEKCGNVFEQENFLSGVKK